MEQHTTFHVEITFLAKVLQDDDVTFKTEKVTKRIAFRELDQQDSSQHLLHFLIASIMEYKPGEGGGQDKMFIGFEKMYELSKLAIKTLLIIGEGVSEGDRTQILADSGALVNFGDWFATVKALPFFIKLRTNLVK